MLDLKIRFFTERFRNSKGSKIMSFISTFSFGSLISFQIATQGRDEGENRSLNDVVQSIIDIKVAQDPSRNPPTDRIKKGPSSDWNYCVFRYSIKESLSFGESSVP